MADLAIKGHPTRGKEVIQLLEMLGGVNKHQIGAIRQTYVYFIDTDGIIRLLQIAQLLPEKDIIYSLEEFLEKYPYKVGDKVISLYGKLGRIRSLIWSERDNQVRYELEADVDSLYFANELQPVEEKETMEGKGTLVQIDLTRELCIADKVEVILGDYEFVLKDGKTYFVKKKPQYPKTYDECCDILGFKNRNKTEQQFLNSCDLYDAELMTKLSMLKVCRDAYWKVAGEQTGLGKPWEPDWDNLSTNHEFIKINKGCFTYSSRVLVFPTAEMRDEFYANFKDLIEQCKELL